MRIWGRRTVSAVEITTVPSMRPVALPACGRGGGALRGVGASAVAMSAVTAHTRHVRDRRQIRDLRAARATKGDWEPEKDSLATVQVYAIDTYHVGARTT